jgi:hypothetical protein
MEEARTRESMPGTEFGIEVDEAIEGAVTFAIRDPKNLDAGCEVSPGDWVWLETIDQKRGLEVVIRIKTLMEKINLRESMGNTEGKIKRRDVCKRLLFYGRQVGDRAASVQQMAMHLCSADRVFGWRV